MNLLLDEMWTPTIAHELRRRGFDVIAISEPEHAPRYAGVPDDAVLLGRRTTLARSSPTTSQTSRWRDAIGRAAVTPITV